MNKIYTETSFYFGKVLLELNLLQKSARYSTLADNRLFSLVVDDFGGD